MLSLLFQSYRIKQREAGIKTIKRTMNTAANQSAAQRIQDILDRKH